VWQFDLTNNLISIGWKELGDVSKIGRDELANVVAANYSDKPLNIQSLWANMIWAFYHEIGTGDIVIARRGLKTLEAVGRVSRPASYSPGKFPSEGHPDLAVHAHPSFLEVVWQDQPRHKVFPTLVFQRRTLVEVLETQYQTLVTGSGPPPEVPEPTETVEDASEFVLEKYLEDFIVSNFLTIFQGQLKIYEDSDEDEGQQFDTNEIGRIDILAIEPSTKSFVVIELKKGRPSDEVVGQTLRYMGWDKKESLYGGPRGQRSRHLPRSRSEAIVRTGNDE
jgi:restriction system protein